MNFFPGGVPIGICYGENILIAPAGHVNNDGFVSAKVRGFLKGLHKAMRRLQGRNDAFLFHGQLQRRHNLFVSCRCKADPALFPQFAKDGGDPDIIEAGSH